MNQGMNGAVHHGGSMANMAMAAQHMNASMMDDDLSEPSSPESGFDTTDLLNSACQDEVTAQLVASGPVGIAAAAAIATGKRKGHPHQFETNPSRRKRQQTRLLRKLKSTIDEYTTRVGQQAVVLCCTPGRPNNQSSSTFKVFGSQPLESVIRSCRQGIMQELESSLSEQAPQNHGDGAHLHELPPLVIDGIPTPIDKMTQAQLRNFIPEMLKYSTSRSKPGWGKAECRPIWWPSDLPWANVRSDARTEEDKKRVSWTEALRTIVKNCYKHHGREDLLHVFSDEASHTTAPHQGAHFPGTVVQTINNPDGTVSIIHIDTGPHSGNSNIVTLPDGTQATVVHAVTSQQQVGAVGGWGRREFGGSPHSTNSNIVTLPDGSQATIVHTSQQQHEATQAVQTLAEVAASQQDGTMTMTPVSVEMAEGSTTVTALTGAHIGQNGQIILTGDGSLGGLSGMITIPASVYQSVSMGHSVSIQDHNSGNNTIQVAVAPQFLKTEVPDATQAVEVTSMDAHDVGQT
ncbi:DNA-binding protein P3A2-like isoform X1 [Littorina saxatilis]|uniref:Nuclear respiratory factor 1 NLS/DNA-binding dimerisation domain-containing protein n=1 Tax=Littorina saxatilis TaxID=31220 RepID=A0AAN9B8U9_9CAEN